VPSLLTGLLMPVNHVALGEHFCVALMQNGLVFSWGDGEEGKLGLGDHDSRARPTMVDFLLPTAYAEVAKRSENKDELLKAGSKLIRKRGHAFQVTTLACGARHTLALTSTHEVFSWGSGCCGQLGHGSRTDEMLPRPVATFKSRSLKAQGVAAGAYHSTAIIGVAKRKAQQLFAWGDGYHGRLGLGDDRSRAVPNEVHYHRLTPRKRVDSGGADRRHTHGAVCCSILEAWRTGGRGDDWLSVETGHDLAFAEVACGGQHTIALTSVGQVYTWGDDSAGQLGHGSYVMQRIPTLLTMLRRPVLGSRKRYSPVLDVRGLGAGRRFSAAITWAGEVWVWGELGGRVLPKPLLLERLESATVVAITCGADHIAILTGEPAMLQARAAELHAEEVRESAMLQEMANLEQRRQEMRARAVEEAEVARARKAAVQAEKRRLKLLARIAKQRAKLQGNVKEKKAKAKEAADADAEEEQGSGAAGAKPQGSQQAAKATNKK